MDRIIIDTHILISLFIENSPYFEKAREVVKDKLVYVPTNILLEFIFLTIKKLKIEEKIVLKKLEEICNNAVILEVSRNDLIEAISLARKYNVSLKSINDLILLTLAKKLDLALFTFDKKLIKIAKKENAKIVN